MPGPRPLTGLAALLFITIGLEVVPAAKAQVPPGPGPIVREAVHHDTSPPLRDIEPAPLPADATNVPVRDPGGPVGALIEVPDPVLQTSPSADTAPPSNQNFEGQANFENFPLLVNPPDTVGDVGLNHYVQMTNLVTSVYDKSGTRVLGPINNNTLWSGFPGECAVNNNGDVIVLYDQFADRWMLSQFAFSGFPVSPVGPYFQCIAISTTSDPTGSYHRYEFLIDDNMLNDYPKFGVWPDAYYMSMNQFNQNSVPTPFTYAGPGAVAFERAQMLQGGLARMVYFDLSTTLGTSYRSQLPSDADGPTAPPTGSPNYFIEADDAERFPAEFAQDQLSLFEFHVDWTTPANSTFGANAMNDPNAITPTAPFDSNMCGFARACIPQKDVADKVDALSGRLMNRLEYRNFGDREVLVANHTVDAGDSPDHSAIRWYELRDPGGTPTIVQQSTYAPDAEHRWMGSIAMDKQGNMALGYSLSSSNRFPAISYTGRLASDPPGTMQNESLMLAGTGSQLGSGNRWGDYSAMNVDPTDDCTFWYTQEYYGVNRTFGWRTRIGSFRFPLCGDLALVMSESADPVRARSDLTYTARVLAGETAMSSVTFTDPLPAGVTFVGVTASQGTCTGGSTVSCNLGNLLAGGTATVDIAVRTGGAAIVTNTASIASTSPDPLPANNVASVVTSVEDICVPPGLTVIPDRTGDATGSQPGHDIQRISVSEPFLGDGVNKVFFTVKVASLSPAPPPSTTWLVSFRSPDNMERFVAMKTDAAGQVRFVHGTGRTGTPEAGTLDAESNFNANGTITLVASPSKIGNPAAGQTLTEFLTRIRIEGQTAQVFPDNAPGDLSLTASYLLSGNASCKPLDLSVDKIGPSGSQPTGQTMTYTVNVTNNGPITATGVLLSDTLPSTVTFVSAIATQGVCNRSGAVVTCLLGTINAGNTATVTIQVTPRQAGTISNTATAVLHQVDSNTGNNTDVVMTSVCRRTTRRTTSC